MPNAILIYDADTLRIEYRRSATGDNRRVAFVFSSLGNRVLSSDTSGGEYLLENGFAVVSVNSIGNDWFQSMPADAFDAIDDALDSARHDIRVAVGSSMGGFAAVCFSRRLRLNHVLAYSPQFDASPQFDGRFAPVTQHLAWRHRITPDSIAPDCAYCLVYDDQDYDSAHIAQLRALIAPERVREIVLRHAGHATVYYLYETGHLKAVTVAALTGAPLPGRELRSNRRQSRQYLKTLSDRLAPRHPALAARVLALSGPVYAPPPALSWVLDRRIPVFTTLAEHYEARRLRKMAFDQAFYRYVNWDVEVKGVDPLLHYIRAGRREGRLVRFGQKSMSVAK